MFTKNGWQTRSKTSHKSYARRESRILDFNLINSLISKSIRVGLNSPTSSINSDQSSTKSKHSTSFFEFTDSDCAKSNPVLLTRIYCFLKSDMHLSIHAGKADKLPIFKQSLSNMQIIYLDQKTTNTPNSSNASLQIKNDGTEPKYNSNIPHSNPIYRNNKPPPLDSQFLANYNKLNRSIEENSVHFIKSKTIDSQLAKLNDKPNKTWTNKSCRLSKIPSLVDENVNHIRRNLESINPQILAIVQNRLGFLLMPINSDFPICYFEANSVDAKDQ